MDYRRWCKSRCNRQLYPSGRSLFSDTIRHDSLAQHFANQLSRRIRDGTLPDIEGGHLNGRFLESLHYDNGGDTVVSSLGQANMSIYRLAAR